MPKKVLLIFPILLIALFAAFFFFAKSLPNLPKGQIHEVILGENGFSPNEISIKPGDSIKFTTSLNEPFWPASDLHPTHGIYPEFDPQEPIEHQNSWTFQFLKSGRWKYHDHLQPIFRGIINVAP